MTCVTCETGNRHTTRHHQRESSALDPARQNRYTNPLHTASAERRHTFGTRLINSQVPQETVRRLLDHSSHQMTAHYARLSDQTIREQWERARKVGISGEELPAETGPLAEAAWMKNNLARAKMALPNGYCALPLQQRCEYANACLTCPVFVTTAEFLPQHRAQHAPPCRSSPPPKPPGTRASPR